MTQSDRFMPAPSLARHSLARKSPPATDPGADRPPGTRHTLGPELKRRQYIRVAGLAVPPKAKNEELPREDVRGRLDESRSERGPNHSRRPARPLLPDDLTDNGAAAGARVKIHQNDLLPGPQGKLSIAERDY